MTAASDRPRTQFCARSVAQVLAENFVCHPSLMRWLCKRTLSDLSVNLAGDGTRVEFPTPGDEPDPGWDLKVISDFGQIEIGFMIAVRFDHRPSAARKARDAARALAESGETAVAFSVWIGPQAELDRMADEPLHYDRTLALEAILAMLEGEARCSAYELQRRREFQIGLIRGALREAAMATHAPVDPRESFRREFIELLADQAPLLSCEDAQSRPDPDCAMLIFDAAALPRWPFMPTVRLAVHFKEGFASILIHDWGEDLEGVATVMEPALSNTNYSLAPAPSRLPKGKPGVLILVDTPPLHPERPFDEQRRKARDCIRLIDEMRAWFTARKSVVSYWADYVGGVREDENEGHKRVRRNLKLG